MKGYRPRYPVLVLLGLWLVVNAASAQSVTLGDWTLPGLDLTLSSENIPVRQVQ